MRDNRWCLICNPKNRSLYWHKNDDGSLWCYCNKCDKGYSFKHYCKAAGIDDPVAFLEGRFHFQEAQNNEIQTVSWPSCFIPLSDPRAAKGVEYIRSRGLGLGGDMYYDADEEGIVFPYYFDQHFCGAQVRFIETRIKDDGTPWKITTLPGTRLGLLFYGWNQTRFMGNVKGIIITEGAFNAISINQALTAAYGSFANNPWRAIACSGSGASAHHISEIKELTTQGMKTILAADTDDAGKKMWTKFMEAKAVSHFAFTRRPDVDWNDVHKELGNKDFAKFFLSMVEKV